MSELTKQSATLILISILNFIRGLRISCRGTGNRINIKGARFVKTKIKISGNGNVINIARGTRLFTSSIEIFGDNHQVVIGSDGIYTKLGIRLEDSSNTVIFGNATTVAEVSCLLNERGNKLQIGQDCMFSHSIEIMCGDSHSIIEKATGRRVNPPGDILIGDHVWVGAHTTILKGSIIGDGSIVGYRSLVTNEIPPFSVAVGSPAKRIHENKTWDRKIIPFPVN